MLEYVFDQVGAFAANDAAEAWCRERGVSVGRMQKGAPRGLLRGDYEIAKWRNLSIAERRALDGTMRGDFRNGPVIVRIAPALSPQHQTETS